MRLFYLLASALMGATLSPAATITMMGSFSSYTTVVGVADPYAFGLPETFQLTLNTSGASILNGVLTMTGGSGKVLNLTGGTISLGATTDITGVTVTGAGSIGGTVNVSFATTIPDATQASLDLLIGQAGSSSLFGFPFTNGAQGFYQGPVTAEATVPEPSAAALLTLGLGLVGSGIARRKKLDVPRPRQTRQAAPRPDSFPVA